MANDDDLDLALALSLAEAESAGHKSSATNTSYMDPTAGDEALAKALQEELNLEAASHRQPPQLPSNPHPALPPQRPPAPFPQHNNQHNNITLGDNDRCAGCGKSLQPSLTSSLFGFGPIQTRYLNALGRQWHPECFCCTACHRPLNTGQNNRFMLDSKGQPYHQACHRQHVHPKCDVCSEPLPETGDGKITWQEIPFWKTKLCPEHSTDGTPRCTSCQRLKPRREDWAILDDGRSLCLLCLGNVIPDTASCQPLYDDVLQFYASKGMPLPARPPLMLVDDAALNAAGNREASSTGQTRADGPIFHTRGLCLTEYSQTVRTVSWRGFNPNNSNNNNNNSNSGGLFGLGGVFSNNNSNNNIRHEEVFVGPTRCQVTAILVLYGLPRLLTGSILAHEVMHAWLRLSGYNRELDTQVEEGLCQLMALLWLEAQPGGGSGGSNNSRISNSCSVGESRDGGTTVNDSKFEQRLAAYLGHQIRTDTSIIYGDGLRAAHDAFQKYGLQTVLAHVKQAGRLPGF